MRTVDCGIDMISVCLLLPICSRCRVFDQSHASGVIFVVIDAIRPLPQHSVWHKRRSWSHLVDFGGGDGAAGLFEVAEEPGDVSDFGVGDSLHDADFEHEQWKEGGVKAS